jgi:translation initiation factor 1
MAKNNKKNRIDIVYSTEDSFEYDYDDNSEEETLPVSEQKLRVTIDRKARKGKTVSLITGFVGTENDLKDLAKTLKTKLGVGGSAKDGEIIIQTESINKIKQTLSKLNYSVK